MIERVLWTPAYIALGANLDDPRAQVQDAFARIGQLPQTRMVARSRLYRSAPLGPQDQPDFVNAVAGVLTRLAPRELLQALQGIEAAMGRTSPVARWGPRRIDLDLIAYADLQCQEERLTLPHAGAAARNFVLYPLCELAPTYVLPGAGAVRVLVQRVGGQGLTVIPDDGG